LHEFLEAVFLGIDMESQVGDKEVWSHRLEKQVKIAKNFNPIVGSRSNICTSFWRPFSFGLTWNPNSVTRRSGQPYFSKGLK
jgi:hypothetical protein